MATSSVLDPFRLELFRYFEEDDEAAAMAGAAAAVNSVSFHKSGELFATATDDGFLELFNGPKGTKQGVLSAERGCQLVQFTHARDGLLYANNRGSPGVNYVSLRTQQCICSFSGGPATAASSSAAVAALASSAFAAGAAKPLRMEGETNPRSLRAIVAAAASSAATAPAESSTLSLRAAAAACPPPKLTSLVMDPNGDRCMTAADGGSLRLWDLRLPRQCVAEVRIPRPGKAHVAFDPTSSVVAACAGDGTLCLFDGRKFGGSPFHTSLALAERLAVLNDAHDMGAFGAATRPAPAFVEDFQCAPNGLFFAAALTSGQIHLVESKMGWVCDTVRRTRDAAKRTTKMGICISPDSSLLCVGARDGSVDMWTLDSSVPPGNTVFHVERKHGTTKVSRPFHASCPRAMAWNPRYAQLVTADVVKALWMPVAPV